MKLPSTGVKNYLLNGSSQRFDLYMMLNICLNNSNLQVSMQFWCATLNPDNKMKLIVEVLERYSEDTFLGLSAAETHHYPV